MSIPGSHIEFLLWPEENCALHLFLENRVGNTCLRGILRINSYSV